MYINYNKHKYIAIKTSKVVFHKDYKEVVLPHIFKSKWSNPYLIQRKILSKTSDYVIES